MTAPKWGHLRPSGGGFTLIEMVTVIAISAILVVGIVQYIGDSVTGYDATASRNRLAQSGRIAIDRLSIELHNSLPNSLRVSSPTAGGDQCLEFVPALAATTYINPPFDVAGTAFDVVEFNPNQEGATSGYVVIYPTQVNALYDAENETPSGFPAIGPIMALQTIADTAPVSSSLSRITLTAAHRFSERSPSSRVYLADEPVSYCTRGSRLYRYAGYGFYDVQPTVESAAGICDTSAGDRCLPASTGTGSKSLIAEELDNAGLTAFEIVPQGLARNALVSIEFKLTRDGESVRMNHQVLTRSVP